MICAWCSTLIARDGRRADFEHNYGMCRDCVEERLARLEPRTLPRSTRLHRARVSERVTDSRAREATP